MADPTLDNTQASTPRVYTLDQIRNALDVLEQMSLAVNRDDGDHRAGCPAPIGYLERIIEALES